MVLNYLKAIIILLVISPFVARTQPAELAPKVLQEINLEYPGLETVKKQATSGNYKAALKSLLTYYRHRDIRNGSLKAAGAMRMDTISVNNADRAKADSAMKHMFQPHKGYGYFNYGKDINWQLWPVADNEVRWQLHRVYWWQSMAIMYAATKDEKYAREWVLQFNDWTTKNPLGLSKDNDKYAWRPLEVSERIQTLPATFKLFAGSSAFTPDFLANFLLSYHQQADYLSKNYSERGNHLLFEAQRLLLAGSFFPEFKDAATWRKSGIEVLNREIKKQVFADGMEWELSPTYHMASINIFLKAYYAAKLAGLEREFPSSYLQTIEKMVMALINISFPDYNNPMFGDSWIVNKNERVRQFQEWSKIFPDNKAITFFASQGKNGMPPAYTSSALKDAGFYTFRSGWDDRATVLILKASPPGEFHAQPDNGTFELWVDGRNFTPDAGCFVYSGDAATMKLRNEYRQSLVHQTLTLNDSNMVITKASLKTWQTNKSLDVLSYTNPSYPQLKHTRTVLFVRKKYFLIVDQAQGNASGKIDVRYHLHEGSGLTLDKERGQASTHFKDGNNLTIYAADGNLSEESSKVSYQYRQSINRPAIAISKPKSAPEDVTFTTVLLPFKGMQAPVVGIKANSDNDPTNGIIDVNITIDDKTERVTARL